jgi:hypothetical protein
MVEIKTTETRHTIICVNSVTIAMSFGVSMSETDPGDVFIV